MKNKYYQSAIGIMLLIVPAIMFSSYHLNAQISKKDTSIVNLQKQNWRESGNRKNFTFMQLQGEFKKDWAGKKPKKGTGYKVFKRWEDYMTPRVYPSGNMNLPSKTYENYMAWQKTNASQNARSRVAAKASIANWTELNPNAKASGFDSGVGRIDFVRFDPTNPNIMYVCSPDGGLWKSINGGANWTTNTDFLPIIGCSDLVIDPTNTQTMYLATGNREYDRNSIGILKSTNGGTTWNTTSLTIPSQNGWKIRRLIMDPTNPLIMIAVLNVGVFKTTDGWATYSQPNNLLNIDLEDTEFKPGDANTVYAIGKDFYKSTDKGETWTKITNGLPSTSTVSRALIAVTAANPAYVYAVYGNADGGYLGTFRSVDSGTSFTQRSSPTSPAGTNNILNCDITTTVTSGQAGHNLAIAVSPTNAELVTIGGCNVLKSSDGGISWTLSSYWLGLDVNNPGDGQGPADYVHADIQSLDYLPGNDITLFATSDGGISKSTNNAVNWTDISNNLRVAQMTNVGQSSLTPYNMITGLQDIGTLKNSNGVWSVTNGGDGEDGFIDRTNDNNIITSNPNGAFALSNDAGITKADITGLPVGLEFLSPIHQDPVDATLVYAGGRAALYKSTGVLTNKDAVWTKLGTPSGSDDGGIKRFEIAPSNNQVIYVLKENNISKSINGGAAFTDITGTLPVSLAQITNIAVSNTDANKVWVTFSGYEAAEKVYKSIDGGTTWTNISAGLPNIAMNTIVYTKGSTTDAIYVGADIGVYYMDNTTAWTPFFTDLPNSIVRDLEIYYPTHKIRAATYGRGLWESDLFVETCMPPTLVTASSNTPVNAGSPINLTSSSTGGTSYAWAGPNAFTSTLQNPTIASATTAMAGTYTVTVTSSGTCTATATTVVAITTVATCTPPTLVTASSNTPVNAGSTINLTSGSTGGTSYVWSGPNAYTSALQNPTIASATTAMAGTYTVTVTSSGTCTATATTVVAITTVATCIPPTLVTASSNTPVNQGGTINLTSGSTGGTSYAWSGPNAYTSALQNPTIASATTAMAGTYTVTVTSSGTCTATATTVVAITTIATCTPPTLVTASSNTPVNQGGTINLTSGSTGGTSYAWSGPNAYTSALQNPTIASATTAMAGTYTVTVTSAGTCTATATTALSVLSVENCSVSLTAVVGTCTPTTNAYNVTGTITFANAPATGTLTVSMGGVMQVFNAPFTSPQAYTLTNLGSDGASHTISAIFSANPTCTNTTNYTAPARCAANNCPCNTLNITIIKN